MADGSNFGRGIRNSMVNKFLLFTTAVGGDDERGLLNFTPHIHKSRLNNEY